MTEIDIRNFFPTYRGNSSGELKQDIFVQAVTGQKTGGYFVEFGVMDGKFASNTLILEQDLGWHGIIAEPGQCFHDQISVNRQCRVDHRAVTGRSGDRVEFKEVDQQLGLSTLITHLHSDNHAQNRDTSAGKIYTVETVSLQDLLDQHRSPDRIDYISIDTEGAEIEILESFDFRRRVDVWTIEHNFQEQARQRIFDIMTGHSYTRLLTDMSHYDDWYVHKDMITGSFK